ncbi:MAG: AHH domain-containing protein, partial [Acetobacteraceae bacterium]|nr:AHH domain-containing protein [Acetobacteraceae bacterium]
EQLKDERFRAHHLVPASNWGEKIDISLLAKEAGWKVDQPSNLIGLPRDAISQAEAPVWLPIHNSGHPDYIKATREIISKLRSKFPEHLTPLQARSILEDAARINEEKIVSGFYGSVLKADK